MLTELKITDFAIIDDLHLDLLSGFNVLTGETGAGKSIVLDAVTLLLGERAELSVIRAGVIVPTSKASSASPILTFAPM